MAEPIVYAHDRPDVEVLLRRRLAAGRGYVWYDYYAEHQRQECLTDNLDRAMSGVPTLDCG